MLKNIIIFIVLINIVIGGGYFYFRFNQKEIKPALDFDLQKPSEIVKNIEKKPGNKNGELLDSNLEITYSMEQINTISTRIYPTYSRVKSKYSVDKYSITYYSLDEKNQLIKIKSQLFVPKVSTNTKFPIYVFGQGTTGIADQCAPSKEKPDIDNWGNYTNHLLTYATQGYIVVFPDYEGFNDPNRVHHYFNAKLESNVLLDGTRATFEFLNSDKIPVKAEQSVFYGGYSQGGHATFSVKDNAPTYAPELPIKGYIGYGPTTNIVNLLKENPPLSPYLLYTYEDFYGKERINTSELLQPKLFSTLRTDVLGKCVSEASHYYGGNAKNILSTKFYNALYNDKLEQEFPKLKEIFDENSTGYSASKTPSLIIQGTADPIVTNKSQEDFIKIACQVENSITYYKYEGVHHYQVRHVSFTDVLKWMTSVLNGEEQKSICPEFKK